MSTQNYTLSSVYSPVSHRTPSASSTGNRSVSSGAVLPPLSPQKAKLQRKSILETAEPESRRESFPFPVTAWRSRNSKKYSAQDLTDKSVFPRPLKVSISQSEIETGNKNNRGRTWGVSVLVAKAKRKFSGVTDKDVKNPLIRRISLSDFIRVAVMKRSDSEKRKMIRDLKMKAMLQKKRLLAKFRLAVKLTIFCSRNIKQHCLRLNENNDELAPYIKRLHFHEDDNTDDLLIDLSKFKANRQMRIPEETKRILSKEVSNRTEQEIYTVTLALRNIKSFSEYPKRMQQKIAEVGLYEKYESKRVIVRQGHPASAFYFILSGAVIVMVMDEESKYARPVAHLYKGQTFGELAIINGTKRNSTVIAKETCEFMSISVQAYNKIFMAGGVKNIGDPDQEVFLKSLTCLAAWPIRRLQENPNKCQFLFFKNGEVIVRDSHYSEWLIIVKSGSVQVLKKLKRVEAFEWKRKKGLELVTGSKKREIYLQQTEWRRILPELGVPLNPNEDEENVEYYGNGRRVPFVHPDENEDHPHEEEHVKKQTQIPNLWPFKVDISDVESGRYLDDNRGAGLPFRSLSNQTDADGKWQGRRLHRVTSKNELGVNQRERSHSMAHEEEKELLGYQPHIRTIMEDIDAGIHRKESVDINPADINPEFVHVQTLTKGQVFGLADVILKDQPSFSVVSHGADCILINKQFYLEHASEKLLRDMRQELCPYPTEEELQERLQVSVDWQAFKKALLLQSVENVSSRRLMRTTVNGTKTQEAFVY